MGWKQLPLHTHDVGRQWFAQNSQNEQGWTYLKIAYSSAITLPAILKTRSARRLARCLLPAFLCAHVLKRDVWVRGSHWPVSHDHIADQLIVLLDREQCSISYFLSNLGASENTHIGQQCFGQLTAVKTGYPLSSITRIVGLGVDPSRSVFFKLSADKLLVSSDRRLKFIFFFLIHMKYVVFMRCTIKILISNWPRTRKFSQLLQAGKTVAFDFSHYGHALVTLYVQFLCSDWS